jgi:hypothetical protein
MYLDELKLNAKLEYILVFIFFSFSYKVSLIPLIFLFGRANAKFSIFGRRKGTRRTCSLVHLGVRDPVGVSGHFGLASRGRRGGREPARKYSPAGSSCHATFHQPPRPRLRSARSRGGGRGDGDGYKFRSRISLPPPLAVSHPLRQSASSLSGRPADGLPLPCRAPNSQVR